MKKGRFDGKFLRLRKQADDTETTRHYTPQDEQSLVMESANRAGIIRPNTGAFRLPADLNELGSEKSNGQPARIVYVIIGLALTFIAIITWFVAQMPDKQ